MRITDEFRQWVQSESPRCLPCKVDKVGQSTVDVSPIDDDYSPIFGVRLMSDIHSNQGLTIYPQVGSVVIVQMLSETDGYVAMYSEIDYLSYRDSYGIEVEIRDGKVMIANSFLSLGDIFAELIDAFSSAILITPSGTGSIDPTTQIKLLNLKTKMNNLLT